MAVYEHRLGPRLRGLPAERLVVVDGFSCKTQIEQATGRRPLHLAQLLHMAKHGDQPVEHRNDRLDDESVTDSSSWLQNSALLLGGVGMALGAWYLGRRILR
jgi:hypothetical protein